MKPRNRRRRASNTTEHATTTLIDKVAEFEAFQSQVLPALREDITSGMSDTEIISKWKAVAAARMISLMAVQENPSVALAATKDVLDRASGKATERKEVTHKLEKLPEQELDAIIASELDAMEDDDA